MVRAQKSIAISHSVRRGRYIFRSPKTKYENIKMVSAAIVYEKWNQSTPDTSDMI